MTELFTDIERDERAVRTGTLTRRVFMTLFAVIAVLALLDVFGQAARTQVAEGTGSTLRVTAPARLRGGLLFQTRVDIDSRTGINKPQLVLDRGVINGMQVSSIEPAAAAESSRDGRLVLTYDPIDPNTRFTVWMQFQVDPTKVGRRSYAIELDDGSAVVARAVRDMTVLP